MHSQEIKITVSHIQVARTARLATIGTLNANTKNIWICCHGYGEIASEFAETFKSIAHDETFIVAPEGLSRFYWGGGFEGKPVASWMTRTDRLNEIEDYSNYLSKVLENIKDVAQADVKIILFGFSQGCATVMRWANNKYPQCNAIVLWSGILPEDIDYNLEYFEDIKLYSRYGDEDRFITAERTNLHIKLMKEKQLAFQVQSFCGKHKVYREPLLDLANKIYDDLC